MRDYEYVRLFQFEWLKTRQKNSRKANKSILKTVKEGLAKSKNAYGCVGKNPHPGCYSKCDFHSICKYLSIPSDGGIESGPCPAPIQVEGIVVIMEES